MAVMSQRQYAERRGVAHSAVQRAIRTGRISTSPDGRIDADVADTEWRKNTRQYAPAVTRRQASVDDDDPTADQYIKARAVRMHFEARIARIQYEQLAGSVISANEVKVAAFTQYRRYRDSMLNIADRVCASIAAENKELLIAAGVPVEIANTFDMGKMHTIMVTEIRKALIEYADQLTDPGA
jgi:hypothetical protein